jgi:hypothetical protein
MLLKIRCRPICSRQHNNLYYQRYFRQHSILKCKKHNDDDNEDSTTNVKNNNENNITLAKGKNERNHMIDNNNKFSNVMSSLLQNSLSSLENYIINQAPTTQSKLGNSQNISFFEIDSDDLRERQLNNIEIPSKFKKLNSIYDEYLDISNDKDVEYLLSINRETWYKVFPEINQAIEKNSDIDIQLILNYYIRSIPEIQIQLKNKELNTTLGNISIKYILKLLINLQWFKNASFIICKMNLSFSELVNLLNELIENELIFQKSTWMKYLFIINFYSYYKSINPLVLTNLDFLSNSKSIDNFKVLNMIYNKNYNSMSELQNDVNQWFEITNYKDKNISLMLIYKSIDLIKSNNLFDLDKQIHQFKKLIALSLPSFLSSTNDLFLGSFLKKLFCLNNDELNYIVINNGTGNSIKEIEKFINNRMDIILQDSILNRKIPIKSFDALTIAQFKPSINISLQLWENNVKGMNNYLKNSIYYKVLIERLVILLNKDKKINEILRVEFSNLSPRRKIKIISSSLIEYLKRNDMLTRNRVGGFINLMNSQNEHSYVMKNVIKSLFLFNKSLNLKYSDLLKLLELISSYSPTLLNKEKLFEFANDIIEKNYESKNDDFFEFNTNERFKNSIEFTELIASIDSESISYISCLEPSILKFYNDYIIENSKSYDEILQEESSIKLFKNLNKTFDLICSNPKNLSMLNPRSYSSKIYLIYQGLLQKLSIELFKLPKQFLIELLQNRSIWICSDEKDWIFKFNKNIFIYGIFLEVLFRRGIRDENLTINLNDLNYLQFKSETNKELKKLAFNDTVWEIIETLSGFEWNEKISNIIIKGEKIGDSNNMNNNEEQNDEESELGSGILMVLNELKKLEGVNYIERNEVITDFNNSRIHNDEKNTKNLNNVTDLLFDSINDSNIDDNNEELKYINNEINEEDNNKEHESNNNKNIINPNSFELTELYQSMKTYQEFVRNQKKQQCDLLIKNKDSKNNLGKCRIKKRYTFKEKERLIRLYSPLRMKSLLIESIVEKNPKVIDAIIRRLFVEYNSRIPISLIHSCMIGIIKSNENEIEFVDKINLIKVLDVIVSVIYNGASKRTHSYLFMNCVRFREFRTLLVSAIINESKKTNSGSLKTLNWAMNKITNSPNLDNYKDDLNKWTNELNNMRELKVGFWNPSNQYGKWNNRREL